jgi:hypothetical protein
MSDNRIKFVKSTSFARELVRSISVPSALLGENPFIKFFRI